MYWRQWYLSAWGQLNTMPIVHLVYTSLACLSPQQQTSHLSTANLTSVTQPLQMSRDLSSLTVGSSSSHSNSYSEELIYCFTYFSTVVTSNICVFLSCRPFVVNTFSTDLLGVEVTSVSWPGQLSNLNTHKARCYNNEMPTEQKHTYIRWDDGGKIGN